MKVLIPPAWMPTSKERLVMHIAEVHGQFRDESKQALSVWHRLSWPHCSWHANRPFLGKSRL